VIYKNFRVGRNDTGATGLTKELSRRKYFIESECVGEGEGAAKKSPYVVVAERGGTSPAAWATTRGSNRCDEGHEKGPVGWRKGLQGDRA